MFGSTAVLPPRTKRWAEAKVLADCIAIKICKLYLYSNEFSLALAYFNRHLLKFAELSRGWGIGEETFEFWSWMAKQYRILAELLEIAVRFGMKLPVHGAPAIPGHAPAPSVTQVASDAARVLGLNPANALHHPGYYYYTAATCTVQRYERYMIIVAQEVSCLLRTRLTYVSSLIRIARQNNRGACRNLPDLQTKRKWIIMLPL